MSRKPSIPSPDVLYICYVSERERTFDTQTDPSYTDRTVIVLPAGIDASHASYVDYVDANGITSREKRNGYLTLNREGRQIIRGDFPVIEGLLTKAHREAIAAVLGAAVVVLGEDLAPRTAGQSDAK